MQKTQINAQKIIGLQSQTKDSTLNNDFSVRLKQIKRESITWAIIISIVTGLITNFIYDLIR